MANEEPPDILIIEDDAVQRESVVRTLQSGLGDIQIAAFSGGTEALEFLFATGKHEGRKCQFPPKLIFLDMRLAGENGLEILARIRSYQGNKAIAHTPVVMFTDSDLVADINNCYEAGANSFVRKPFGYTEFQSIIKDVARYWLNLNYPAEDAG